MQQAFQSINALKIQSCLISISSLCFFIQNVTYSTVAGWALSLEAGEGDWNFDYSFFSVVIELTDKGHG